MSNLIVANTEVPLDAEGRVSLNALHRASGAGESKEPNKWCKTNQAQDLIEEVESQPKNSSVDAITKTHGGSSPGIYAHELLAISYAGWISPAFQVQVNQTFLDYRRGQLPQTQPQPQSQLDVLEGMVTQLKEQERIAKEAKEESDRANQRLDQIETASDHYAVVGYARDHGYGSISNWQAALLGRKASKFCQDNGVEPGKTQHPYFGRVNTYPKWILDAVFEESR